MPSAPRSNVMNPYRMLYLHETQKSMFWAWRWFHQHINARKPKWTAACDTLRVLEGEPLQLRGKILPFNRKII